MCHGIDATQRNFEDNIANFILVIVAAAGLAPLDTNLKIFPGTDEKCGTRICVFYAGDPRIIYKTFHTAMLITAAPIPYCPIQLT